MILNKHDYLSKINVILSDNSKFSKIVKDPTSELKSKTNKLISTLNASQSDIKINKIVGDFSPGYIYGNVKTHKSNNPLRPIISQIPTATYQIAKKLNKLLTPYLPDQYTIKSTNDFIDILQTNRSQGVIASLDVESLFTNVPIDATIDIILKRAYNHATLPALKIPPLILKQLLELCTKHAPFRTPTGELYLQVDGIAMGSPLGPLFANFYAGDLEENVFNNYFQKPHIYTRYVDDIFLQIDREEQIIQLKEIFQQHSVLKFTHEMNIDNKLPFLDVIIDSNETQFKTNIYRKPTNFGTCMNGAGECTEKYKNSVIHNFLNRAYKVNQNWQDLHTEIQYIKQMLINNNYSNTLVDKQISKFLNSKLNINSTEPKKSTIDVYYQNQMHGNYKLDERILKNIISDNTTSTQPDNKINLVIYYKNKQSSSLIMKNNLSPPLPPMHQTNLVYKFICPIQHCKAEYIGYTECTLSRRMVGHCQN